MAKILITKPVLEEGLEIFRGHELIVANGLDRAELLGAVKEYDAIVSMLSDKCTSEVFAAAAGGRLKIVANYAVGYDNIDVNAAREAGIHATNTPEVLTEATAEMAWALLFAAARRIGEGEKLVRSGQWKGWGPTQLIGSAVSGKTLGIVGAGRIGRAFGKLASGFRMKLLYYNRSEQPDFEKETGATRTDLDTLLSSADYISIHLPGTPETHHLISEKEFGRMKSTAILLNTGRGTVVDEAALVDALKSGKIGAAGLDVYEKEPVVHEGLKGLDNVVLAPHLGSATRESRTAMAERCLHNIESSLAGDTPQDLLW